MLPGIIRFMLTHVCKCLSVVPKTRQPAFALQQQQQQQQQQQHQSIAFSKC
jgi:hypothetical protein